MENAGAPPRRLLVERAIAAWTAELIDLGGRNNLLYYRDLKTGTLDLGDSPTLAIEALVRGTSVSLRKLFPDDEAHQDAARRARAIYRKGQEHFEERGIETVFLAWGLASWPGPIGRAQPAAPVLLRPATLVPRSSALDQFDLVLMGEMEVSPTLLHLLETDFRCRPDMSKLELDGAIDTIAELDHVLEWLGGEVTSVQGFEVMRRAVLGTFSYMKMPIVLDLEQSADLLEASDLVAAIAGDEGARVAVRERHRSADVTLHDPNHVPPADEFLILDADSSQNYAINAVLAGSDMIVRGPPGTGKSQTIANLIATLVARGRKVLFVAEKRAAIDAVLKRLKSVGLEDIIFDLHGGVAGRRQLLASLAGALEAVHTIPSVNRDTNFQELERRRRELLMRADALHRKRAPWGISAFEIESELLGMLPAAETGVMLRGDVLEALGETEFAEASNRIYQLTGLGGLSLWASGSPWKYATVTSAEDARRALEISDHLRSFSLPAARRAIDAAAAQTGIIVPRRVAQWGDLIALWANIAETMKIASPTIYARPLQQWLIHLEPASGGLLTRLAATVSSGEYRKSKRDLTSLLTGDVPMNLHELVSAAWLQQERFESRSVGSVTPSAPAELDRIRSSYAQLMQEVADLARYLGVGSLEGFSADELDAVLAALLGDRVTLTRLPDIHRLEAELRGQGLGELLDDIRGRQLGLDLCRESFRYVWLRSIFEHISLDDPLIGAFDGEQHTKTVADYSRLDREHVEATALRVQRRWAEAVVRERDTNPDAASLIEFQARLRRRTKNWKGFREIVDEAQSLLLELKPCWVMSPLVVSQVLPPEKLFDVVVFDEASQVRQADAMPAIARGERLVVAGDERQLPPTSFFMAATAETDVSLDQEPVPSLAATEGFESILDALAMLLAFRQLGWHYRSRDERLIAFSNAHFYDQSLTTFPGISGEQPVEHVLVPFAPGLPGQEESATREVEEVVRRAFAHAEAHPNESLGVIAMGIRHANRIEEALLEALHERPDLEDFFAEDVDERFFVKNLERVQGDERDAIILSIGYGKNSEGRLLYRFGPLNQEGGERRLNVAVTRARRRLTLVSSFTAADMDPNRISAEGARALRSYLQFAESRGANLGDRAIEKPPLNPFEIDVRDTLVRAGIPLVAQHGSSGYRIDFVAQHREKPGEFVLAIECDGASYHSQATTRDRDRLRQQHLENLGWRFHRIWSTDWFTNKPACVERVLAAYQRSLDGGREPVLEETLRAKPNSTKDPQDGAETTRSPRPSVPPGFIIDDYTDDELISLIEWIESDGLLRTKDQLLEEAMRDLAFERRGKKIVARLTDAVDRVRSGRRDRSD